MRRFLLPPKLRLRFLPDWLGNVQHYRGGDWEKMRQKVLQRDGYRCRGCYRTEAQGAKLSINHIMAYAYGGKNTMENLITLCEICHPTLEIYGAKSAGSFGSKDSGQNKGGTS